MERTSNITIRPFIPCMKDEEKEGREPFAVLKYGNVTIELDYTIIDKIKFDAKNLLWSKTTNIFFYAMKEILNEMNYDIYGDLPSLHRDNNHPFLDDFARNPLHKMNEEITT